MRFFKWIIGVTAALGAAGIASATTCPSNTWCFGSNPTTVGDGTTYSTASGSTVTGSITVFSEQVTTSNNKFYESTDSTVNGLFSTNDSVYDEGIGIAPYDPQEGGSPFTEQQGITDSADSNNSYGNILVLELGSNIAEGTTLSFLLEAGIDASTDTVQAYYQDGGSQNVSPASMTKFASTTDGQISTNGTTPQFSLTKNTSGIEFVAIEADCHYILLDTITGTPGTPGVPEPRFYGMLLAGLLGVAGMLYQRRQKASANA
jgi:hypothetical protein